VLESAPFVLERPRISMLVAGALGSYVRALQGDREIARVQPTHAHELVPMSLNLGGYVGQIVRLQIVDEDATTEGARHVGIVVDDLRIVL
jgi:hypothetical protein